MNPAISRQSFGAVMRRFRIHRGLAFGVIIVAALLAYEHALVRPDDLRRLDTAFFTMNGVISVVFAVFVIADAAV